VLAEYAAITGVMFGLFFCLVGLGLNLVFGVLRLVNLAHGDFVMLGAFGAYFAYSLVRLNPLLGVLGEVIPFFALGFALYYLLVPRVNRSRDPEMVSLIMFFGVSQVIEAIAFLAFGNSERSVPGSVFGTHPVHLLGQTYPAAYVVSALACIPVIVVTYLYLYRTKLGYATRAVIASREESAAVGINVSRVSAAAFGAGIVLASAAGVLSLFVLSGTSPGVGVGITVTAFAVTVVGSLGNPMGTLLGGLIYGLALSFTQAYISTWSELVPYVLLLAVLLVRPSGLLGRAVRSA
jgi:branched-chain amino acid transport system permease protein